MNWRTEASLCLLPVLWCTAVSASHTDPCAAVRHAVGAAVAPGVVVDVQCTVAPGDAASVGGIDWMLAGPLPAIEAGSARFVLTARQPDGAVRRTVLAARLALRSEAWVLQRQVRAGEEISASNLVRTAVDWLPGERHEPAPEKPPLGRARHALRTGQVVEPSHVVDDAGLLSGDAVTALLRQGELVVRMPATLVRPARVGERVLVQLKDRRSTIEGRLVDRHLVDVGL